MGRNVRLGHGHEHILALDLHLIGGLFEPAAEGVLAGSDVELPAVPRAGHDRPLQLTFGQRPPLVRADPVDAGDTAAAY